MALLTDAVILTAEWDNISNGAAAVYISHSGGVYVEWCAAESLDDADECPLGHRVYGPVLWEASDSNQDLYMRSNAAAVAVAEAAEIDYPQIVVTIYPA